MKTFNNMQAALNETENIEKLNYFVISANEIHCFETLYKAIEDAEFAKFKENIDVEILNRKEATEKYLF